VTIAALTTLALTGGVAFPVWAAGPDETTGDATIGGFGVGDGLEAMVDERDGAVTLRVPVAGMTLTWDSRDMGSDRYSLGAGWSPGIGHIETTGGVRVVTTNGTVHELDPTHPSGLAGYGAGDLHFAHAPGVLPARQDGAGAAVEYAYVLRAAGGTATYFNGDGDPVTKVSGGARVEWEWHETTPHLLTAMISADGVRSEWELTSSGGAMIIRPAANLGELARQEADEWRLQLEGDHLSSVIDPTGGQTRLSYRGDHVERVDGESGAVTTVTWRGHDDGVIRAERLTTSDRTTGQLLSERSWRATDGGSASAWPAMSLPLGTSATGIRHTTELSDGSTVVRSTYDDHRRLQQRDLFVANPSGTSMARSQAFSYADEDTATGGANWSRPVSTSLTYRNARGDTRMETEHAAYDEYGRTVHRQTSDGTSTRLEYAEPARGALPALLPVRETTTARDGSRALLAHTLNDEQTASVVTDSAVAAPGAEPVRTSRVERKIEPDGFVSEERERTGEHDQDPPLVTRRTRSIDLHSGTVTISETIAADSAAASTLARRVSLVHGGVATETDAVGNTSHTEHDALGRPIATTDAADRRTTFEYSTSRRHGVNSTSVMGPDGVSRTEIRDAIGRVIELRDDIAGGEPAAGHVRVLERRSYPDPATIEVTDPWGAITTTRQDAFGRAVETTAPNGLVLVTDHDDVANTTTSGYTPTGTLADAELRTIERRDQGGNVIATKGERHDGRAALESTFTYDGFERVLTTDDGVLATRIDRDGTGNDVTTTFAPVSASSGPVVGDQTLTAIRRFDTRGNSLEKTLANDTQHRSGGSRTLDELGRTETKTDPRGRVTTVDFTADGLPELIVSGGGQRTEHVYDPRTRLLELTRVGADGRPAVTTAYEHDPKTDRVVGVYDPADREATEIVYAWNAFGRLDEVRYPDGARIGYDYDQHGRRTAIEDTAGNRTEFTYDATGALTGATQSDRAGNPSASVDSTYDAYGRLERLARGNGVTTSYSYTSVGEVEIERTDRGGDLVSERRYEYDSRSHLIGRADLVHERGSTAESTTTFVYDALGRLTGSVRSAEQDRRGRKHIRTDYELTASGDIASESVTTGDPSAPTAQVHETRAFAYDPLGELLAVTTTHPDGTISTAEQTYDPAGNLVRGADGTRADYDAANRPIARTGPDGDSTTFGYWADGTRRQRISVPPEGSASSTRFYWDGTSLVNERFTGATAGITSYLVGAGRHARSVAASDGAVSVEYHGTDRHGNVTELTDATGDLIDRYTYTDYGVRTVVGESAGTAAFASVEPRAADDDGLANRFGFAGEYTEDDGTQFLRVRVYNPVSMRFEGIDPAERYNGYAFADLDPVTKVDPTGRTPQSDAIALSFSIAGTVLAVAGLFTGGVSLSAFGLVSTAVAAFDAGVAIADTLHVAGVIQMNDDTTLGLSTAALLSGAAVAAVGFARARLSKFEFRPNPPGFWDLGRIHEGRWQRAAPILNDLDTVENFLLRIPKSLTAIDESLGTTVNWLGHDLRNANEHLRRWARTHDSRNPWHDAALNSAVGALQGAKGQVAHLRDSWAKRYGLQPLRYVTSTGDFEFSHFETPVSLECAAGCAFIDHLDENIRTLRDELTDLYSGAKAAKSKRDVFDIQQADLPDSTDDDVYTLW
jgi:RHS repeat-associated protein